LTNSSSGHRGDEQHNTKVDEDMHSREAKIIELVGEHLQTKEKTKIGGGIGAGSRKGKGLLPPPLRSVF
jgi:hypothetical protein